MLKAEASKSKKKHEQRKKQPTNEKETKMQAILQKLTEAPKKINANIGMRRSTMLTQQSSNYRNELSRLNGELQNSRTLSLIDQGTLLNRVHVLDNLLHNNRIPIIGAQAQYKY